VPELSDLAHLRDHRLDGPRAEQVAEHGLVAEVAAKRTSARGHQRSGGVLPVPAPVGDVLVVRYVAAIRERQMGHVLGTLPRGAPDHLAIALEHDTRDLVEAAVAEVLHDRD